ncbi:MAG: hypothetical protein WCA20_23885 [Candidatus Sulfotelmatobacter sp.]
MKPYCQRRKIDDGIRLNQQPPQDDCWGRPARDYIIVYGEKQWLCPWHYDDHIGDAKLPIHRGGELGRGGEAPVNVESGDRG